MNTMLAKLKNYVINLHLGLDDLCLLVGFLFTLPFYVFIWQFMTTINPDDILFKPWMMIVCFSGMALSWGLYFFLEIKKGYVKNNVFTWLFLFFILMSVLSVVVEPSHSEIEVEARFVNDISQQFYPGIKVGDVASVITDISDTHRLLFAFTSVILTCDFYIVFFVLPKRVNTMFVFYFAAAVVLVLMLVLTFYSYIAEHDKYIPFLSSLFKGDVDGIYKNAMMSFSTHRVTYAKYLMGGVLFSLILQSRTNKWYWYLPALYCYINMIFSWGKAAIAFTTITIAIYLAYRLVATYNDHEKRNKILGTIYGGIILIALILVAMTLMTDGVVIPQLYQLLNSFSDNRTIQTRTYIWDNIIQRLNQGYWFIGRGLGIHNYLLYPMNLLNGDATALSHSSYYTVLGAGGIVALLGYLGLHAYFAYAFWKCYKVNKFETIGLSIGFFGFFIYSFTEGVTFLLLPSMIPLIIYYNLLKREAIKNS